MKTSLAAGSTVLQLWLLMTWSTCAWPDVVTADTATNASASDDPGSGMLER